MPTDLSSPVPAPEDIGEMLDRFAEAVSLERTRFAAIHNTATLGKHAAVVPQVAAARSEILLLVSRLRSQLERMEADLPTREEAWEMIEDLAPRHEMGCSHWKIPDREDTPEIDTDCDCTRKPFYEKLRRLSSDSGTGGEKT